MGYESCGFTRARSRFEVRSRAWRCPACARPSRNTPVNYLRASGPFPARPKTCRLKNLFPGCSGVTKRQMLHDDAVPVMHIDAQTYEVRADGVVLSCEPALELPMTQRYFLF